MTYVEDIYYYPVSLCSPTAGRIHVNSATLKYKGTTKLLVEMLY